MMPCREFGEAGPFWGRQYIFWHDGKPLTLIYEVFSTSLQRLLGPSVQPLTAAAQDALFVSVSPAKGRLQCPRPVRLIAMGRGMSARDFFV